MGEEEKKGGVVLPRPQAPSKVGAALPPPANFPKELGEGEKEEVAAPEKKVEPPKEVLSSVQKLAEEEKEPVGVITIKVFKYRPFEVDFSGNVAGGQVDLAWRYMMKQYRVWKHDVAKADKK